MMMMIGLFSAANIYDQLHQRSKNRLETETFKTETTFLAPRMSLDTDAINC